MSRRLRKSWLGLAAACALLLPAAALPQSMTLCRAKPQLLDLGTPLNIARKAIAGFRLREGMPIGCKVTLRKQRMWEFLDRLISLAIPRVRDFRGLNPSAFDGNGNYSLGLVEQLVFPELNPDKFTRVQGMNISFVTSTSKDDEGRLLLRLLGMPFKRESDVAGAA